jgi:hypothetical protein
MVDDRAGIFTSMGVAINRVLLLLLRVCPYNCV